MSANIPEHELPNWMKQAQRGIDWGALLVLALALLAGWSFLSQNQLSASTENEHLVFQATDIAQAMREGIFYPRWSPYALGGYGAPIPHYYPQAAAYLVALVDLLFTNDMVFALRLVYLIGFLIAGASIYSLVAQRSHALAGIFAAIAYLYNPYLGLTVPYLLGDLALFLGLAFMPLLLWIANRLLLREQAMDVAFMALIVAFFAMTIPRLLPQTFVLVLLLAGFDFTQSRQKIVPRFVWIFGAALLGAGLAAPYWLPAALERHLVQWHPALMASEPQQINFPELFSQPAFLDSGFLTYENYFSLGWGLGILAFFGGLALILKRELLGFHGAFLLYGLALMALLLAFPYQTELLASISLCLAIGGAYLAKLLTKFLTGFLSFSLLLLLTLLAMPYWTVPSPALAITESDASAQLQYEAAGYGLAVLPSGLPIPSNLNPQMPALFDEATAIDSNRVLNLELSLIDESAYYGIYQVFSEETRTIAYQRAWFPGWQAWLDNQQLPIILGENGLISVQVPAANTSLTFLFGATWLRTLSWIITLLAFATAIALWWLRWRRIGSDYDNSPLLNHQETRLVFFVLIIGLISHLGFQFWFALPSRHSLQNANYVRNEVDASLQLLAYEIRENRLYLYWEASRPSLDQYQIRLRLMQNENIIMQTAYSHPGYFPTNRWLRGFVVLQSYDLPEGDYSIIVDVFRCEGICSQIGNPPATVEFRLE